MKIQLQSILLPTDDVCSVPELYFHKVGKRIDFDGYFNLFYIKKRKAYTQIEKLCLELTLKGYDELLLVHEQMTSQKEVGKIRLTADTEKRYTVELPYSDCGDGVFWFALVENTAATERKVTGFYYGMIADDRFRLVNIGVNICTFKREPYVARTLGKLSKKLMNNRELHVSDHMQVFVIDNGRTLDQCEAVRGIVESDERLHIIPNMNAGGSGGFTRGMIEILDRKGQDGFTHVLMMDDDAVVEPDTLVRLYGFLATVKDEWKDITVGGALLREEYPYILFCAGEWWENGYTVPNPDYNLDLRNRDKATCEYLTGVGNEHKQYSGWWCCCYSLNIVRDDNLPIPFFIHHDDIEYGIRNRDAGIVFLNGVNIWHRDVELGMPGPNTYYDVRNTLIEMALQRVGKAAAVKCICRRFVGSVLRYRYKDVELICRGVEDFLKGPGWLYEQRPEELHKEICGMGYRPVAVDELLSLLLEDERDSVIKQIKTLQREIQENNVFESNMKLFKVKLWHLVTCNGWLLPAIKDVKVIRVKDSVFEGYRRKRIVLYDGVGKKLLLYEKKYGQLINVFIIFFTEILRMISAYKWVSENHRRNIGKITDRTAWERFLGMYK